MSSISVIIPTKNRIGYLLETLDNINAQTLKPVEIIIVDDRSTDGTEDILKEKKIENLIYVKSKKPGPGAARNEGLKIAQGKYIQFFDSDDLMTLNKLEKQCSLLERSGSGMVYSPYIMASLVDHEWVLDCILNYKPLPSGKNLRYFIIRGWNIITQACLFKREALDEVGEWNETIYTHEDYLYLYRLSNIVRKPLFTDACAVIYRQHTQQLTDAHSGAIVKARNLNYVLRTMKQGNLGLMDRFIVQARLYQNQKYGLKNYEYDWKWELGDCYLRGINKLGRLKTGTGWQPMHGPSNDLIVFKKYLSMLNRAYEC